MDSDIRRALTRIIASAPSDRLAWLKASTQQSNIHRQAFQQIRVSLKQFQANSISSRWFILPGLRGVGKTTILTQLYLELPNKTPCNFFLSLERIRILGAGIKDVLAVLEELVGSSLETAQQPIYIFLDEVQYLDDWALGLKTIFDRAPRIFMVCTGSSAIGLQSNPDVARRSLTIPVYPLDFTEYVAFKNHYSRQSELTLSAELRDELQSALLKSQDCQSVFMQLQKLSGEVTRYWSQIDKKTYLDEYMRFGTLPFIFQIDDEFSKWSLVDALLNESLAKDVGQFAQMHNAVIAAFPALLRLLAESDTISMHRIATITGFNKRTVMNMLQALCVTEILNPISPSGSAYRQINRPNKYLFTSSAMRLSLAKKAGMSGVLVSRMSGKLLEDIVGLYLKRISSSSAVHYDSKPGGADFILFNLHSIGTAIPIEVELHKRNARQIWQTLQKIEGKYGLVITDTELDIDPDNKTVFIPLEYFLLV